MIGMLRSSRALVVLLSLGCFAQAKHVGEAELTDAVSIRYLTLSLAEFTASVKFYINLDVLIAYHL